MVVAFVVHTSARRADRAVAAQRESAALAELTHTLLGSTDQMTVLLDHAVDMFGARRALVVRRGSADDPGGVVAESARSAPEPGGADGPAGADEPETRVAADDDHDVVLLGVRVAADRQRLLAAFAASLFSGAFLVSFSLAMAQLQRRLSSARNASIRKMVAKETK